MRYAGINYNDFAAAPGVSVTFYTQGCPHRCKGCHNPETWDYNGGKEFTQETVFELDRNLEANGVQRNFCIMGGEPLCEENIWLTNFLVDHVKAYHPGTKVYLWTGYTIEELLEKESHSTRHILSRIDFLIDGPYVQELRDITLSMRGSKNQRVINLQNKEFYDII